MKAEGAEINMYQFKKEEYEHRMEWYKRARFGMFIHWGLYAIPARGEWIRSYEKITKEDYMKYYHEFNPVDCDPAVWVKTAKMAGMKYIVLTAKHHDGFCLFDSQYTEFKSTNTQCHRDFVAEYIAAARAEGMKVGLYYSLLDWYHEDYPHYGDRIHPMRDNEKYKNDHRDFERYLTYMHNQVKELCTNYGKIDILWFDFSYDDMRGEKWRASELVSMVRSLQPEVIIDNRMEVSGEGFGSLASGNPTPYHGDFVSPEQIIPPQGIKDVNGDPLVWEACITMNNNWGYHATDHYFKPASMIIKKLVECVSKGGNLLLNVGPDAHGHIPEESMRILEQVGVWMRKNQESIYHCGYADLEQPESGRITRNGSKLYYHIYENTFGPMPLRGIKKDQIISIRRLRDGCEIPISTSWVHSDYPDIVFANLGPDPVLPDPVDTVLVVELRSE
jgi:alpha-L-fucosidase